MTDLTIFELLDQRVTEIRDAIAALKSELETVQQMRSIARGNRKTASAPRKPRAKSEGKATMADQVRTVLTGREQGATSAEIVTLIKDKLGADVAAKSLSPRLSQMRKDGVLVLDGRVWTLAEGHELEDTPSSEAPVSETAVTKADAPVKETIVAKPAAKMSKPAKPAKPAKPVAKPDPAQTEDAAAGLA